jgi:CRP-like cAMP-binding protein
LHGVFVWARRALKHQKRRFPARAVGEDALLSDAPRNAHVKATTETLLYVLSKVDLHAAGLDEGLLSLSLSNLLSMDNPYSYKKCQ